jgi:hypothetical protein
VIIIIIGMACMLLVFKRKGADEAGPPPVPYPYPPDPAAGVSSSNIQSSSNGSVLESFVSMLSGPMVHVDMIPVPEEEAKPPPQKSLARRRGYGEECEYGDDESEASLLHGSDRQPMSIMDATGLELLHAYTSYMFEPFSKNSVLNTYTPGTHTALKLPMSQAQCTRAIEFLEACVRHAVPYNYPDLLPCVMPGMSMMLKDLDYTDVAAKLMMTATKKKEATEEEGVNKKIPPTTTKKADPPPPPSLFCSQAALLCIKHALDGPMDRKDIEYLLVGGEDGGYDRMRSALSGLNSRLTTPTVLYNTLRKYIKPERIYENGVFDTVSTFPVGCTEPF